MTVLFSPEDGSEAVVFDFSQVASSPELLRQLAAGFASATGPGGRWRTFGTATAAAELTRRFARDIQLINPSIRSIAELNAETWWAWRAQVEERTRWPGQINLMRALLSEIPEMPSSTRKALRARASKPKTRSYQAYSRDEFSRIRAAASRMVRAGETRLANNTRTLQLYRDGNEAADAPACKMGGSWWTAGQILDHLVQSGRLPYKGPGSQSGMSGRRLVDLTGATAVVEACFANTLEIYSLMVLFTCERGFNVTVMSEMTIDADDASDPISERDLPIVHLDKPRRGPSARFFDASLTGEAGRLWQRTIAITNPARAVLADLGYPTDRLFVARLSCGRSTHASGVFRVDWRDAHTANQRWRDRAQLLADDGSPLRLNLRRLRLTEQVLSQRARQNSPASSESIYRLPDPQTHREAAPTIVGGQEDAIRHARSTVKMRTLSDKEVVAARRDPADLAAQLDIPAESARLLLAGHLDTATGACLDFGSSPLESNESGSCAASFLACFGCQNAVATPSHLPRLVLLHDALLRTASVVSEAVWEMDYQQNFQRLSDLLDTNTTTAERAQARTAASDDEVAMIDQLLRRRLDS